jgi:hypothetical protein
MTPFIPKKQFFSCMGLKWKVLCQRLCAFRVLGTCSASSCTISMFMSCTFFDRIPSCGCNLSSIILCSGHKDHMLYRVLGILCGLILWVKDLSSLSLDFCKFSDAISSLKMCKRDARPCRPSYFTFSHSQIPFFPIQNLYLFLCLYSSGYSSWAYEPYAFS